VLPVTSGVAPVRVPNAATVAASVAARAFAVLMAVVAVWMLRGDPDGGGACRTRAGGVNWRSCLGRALSAGAAVGLLTGLAAHATAASTVGYPVIAAALLTSMARAASRTACRPPRCVAGSPTWFGPGRCRRGAAVFAPAALDTG
jgi:hypothetical protein